MSSPTLKEGHHKLRVVMAAVALIFGAFRMLTGAEPRAPSPDKAPTGPQELSSVPVPGPLAQPRLLKQVGVRLLQTLAEALADNPRTPEKRALGMKLFFDPRLSVDGKPLLLSSSKEGRAHDLQVLH